MQAMVEKSADHDRHQHSGQREEKISRDCRHPQSDCDISDQPNQAGRQKIALQRRTKLLRRPLPQRTVNGQRRTVHSVGAAQNSRQKPGSQQPCGMILLQSQFPLGCQRINRKHGNDEAEDNFHHMIVDRNQQQQPQRNAEQRRDDQPGCAADFDLSPILNHNHRGNQDRYQNRQRRGDGNGNTQGQQGNRNQRLAKAERGPNERGEENYRQHIGCR